MAATAPITNEDLEFDNGSFDSAAFAAQTLSNWQALAAVIDHTLLKPDATRDAGGEALRRGRPLPLCLRHGQPGLGFHGGRRSPAPAFPWAW